MIDLEFGVKLITREEWGALPPQSWSKINASYGSTGHWEGPELGYPWDHSACFAKVRGIQLFHMNGRGWVDIAYSDIACPHGYVFEGRGPGKRTAANGTNVGNNSAYAVCYLGGENDGFTEEGERAMLASFNRLQYHGGAGPGRNGHRDWKSTECPGDEIYLWIHSGQPIETEGDWLEMVTEAQLDEKLAAMERRLTNQIIGTKPVVVAFNDVIPGQPDHWYLDDGINRQEVTKDEARQEVAQGNARWWARDANGNWIEEPVRVPRGTLEAVPLEE